MAADYIPPPILLVTAGVPVYTADNQKLGKVKEIEGEYFKVETGLFQRDYWLGADAVVQAVPDQSVVLNLTKAQVEDHKITGRPPAA